MTHFNPGHRIGDIVAVAVAFVVVLAGGMTAGYLEVQQHEQETRAAAYVEYVEQSHRESDIHNRVNVERGIAIYTASAERHAAAVTKAKETIAAAKGKVDASALSDDLSVLSRVGDVRLMDEATATLTERTTVLRAEITAYDAEQERLRLEKEAAERAAAEEAARQAAEQESWSGGGSSDGDGGSSAPAPSGSGVDYTLYVYASGQSQSLVDACAGAVEWASGWFAEHWSCGGSSFPQWAGAIVEVVGYGTYRVTGVLGYEDATDGTASWLPSGTFYQTCQNGDPAATVFIGLERL